MLADRKADYHDADLTLRIYDLRREPVMRASRIAIIRQFWPKTWDDVKAVVGNFDHPLNAPFRQVTSYWEMAYSLVRHGVVHPGLFLETNGEGLLVFAKIESFLEQYRKEFNPRSFRNAEWVATECPEGRAIYEGTRARVRKMAESR